MGAAPPHRTRAPNDGANGAPAAPERQIRRVRRRSSAVGAMPTLPTMAGYPQWFFYPSHQAPPEWVRDFVSLLATQQGLIDSTRVQELTSDRVLSLLADGLAELGYAVETGKRSADKIRRPVLFGDQGVERVAYEVDAFHDDLGVAVEIEAGRGARGNAIYRDLVRTSLIVGARFLALGVMAEYRHLNAGRTVAVQSYRDAENQLDAIYASGRLRLPFEGVLLFGY
jgi:hypothetical protein